MRDHRRNISVLQILETVTAVGVTSQDIFYATAPVQLPQQQLSDTVYIIDEIKFKQRKYVLSVGTATPTWCVLKFKNWKSVHFKLTTWTEIAGRFTSWEWKSWRNIFLNKVHCKFFWKKCQGVESRLVHLLKSLFKEWASRGRFFFLQYPLISVLTIWHVCCHLAIRVQRGHGVFFKICDAKKSWFSNSII